MKNKLEIRNCPVCNSGPDSASLFLEKSGVKLVALVLHQEKSWIYVPSPMKCSNCDLVYADSHEVLKN